MHKVGTRAEAPEVTEVAAPVLEEQEERSQVNREAHSIPVKEREKMTSTPVDTTDNPMSATTTAKGPHAAKVGCSTAATEQTELKDKNYTCTSCGCDTNAVPETSNRAKKGVDGRQSTYASRGGDNKTGDKADN